MRAFRLSILVLMLAMSIPCPASQTTVHAQTNAVYIALGDSIAAGIGSSLPDRRGYPAQVRILSESLLGGRVDLTNHAVPGETAESFLTGGQLDAFTSTVGRYAEGGLGIDLVTVSLGGNDMLAQQSGGAVERQQALSSFRENFEEAVARIRGEVGENTTLVLTTYYDLSEGDPAVSSSDAWWIEQFNQGIRDAAQQHNAVIAEVGEVFRGHVREYTHHPYDIHPKNQGYRAIAQQVWSAIGLDREPPEIEVLSGQEAARRTPTLQFTVVDNVDLVSVTVTAGHGAPLKPVNIGGGRFVLLLDFRGDDATEYVIVVEARDSAGNVDQVEQRIFIQTDEKDTGDRATENVVRHRPDTRYKRS
jgi:acyl-CoA thioesterase I